MSTEWPYYDWKDGRLVDECGCDPFPNESAKTANEWQEWLELNDIRGSVR